MMGVPLWLLASQALGTFFLGLAVFYVSWRQWKTAHERAILDMFDRRYALYDQLKTALVRAALDARAASEMEAFSNVDRYTMLFGDDVVRFVKRAVAIVDDLAVVQAPHRASRSAAPASEREEAALEAVWDCLVNIDGIFLPYLRVAYRNDGGAHRLRRLRVFLLGR